jgi:hypothetical protein
MSDYSMGLMAEMHAADLLHEAERERLIRQAKSARGNEVHADIVGTIRSFLGFGRNNLRPNLNPGN